MYSGINNRLSSNNGNTSREKDEEIDGKLLLTGQKKQ